MPGSTPYDLDELDFEPEEEDERVTLKNKETKIINSRENEVTVEEEITVEEELSSSNEEIKNLEETKAEPKPVEASGMQTKKPALPPGWKAHPSSSIPGQVRYEIYKYKEKEQKDYVAGLLFQQSHWGFYLGSGASAGHQR